MSQRLKEAANKARLKFWNGFGVDSVEKGPELINNEAFQAINAAGDALIDIAKVDAQDNVIVNGVQARKDVFFEDDFFNFHEVGAGGPWDVVEVNLNTAIGLVADGAGGQLSLAMDADNNAEDAVLYHSDNRFFDVSKNLQIEFRAKVSVLPTLTGQIVMGMAGDHNLAKDSILEHAWFKLDGSGAVVVETNDTTNDNDDEATGVTVLTSEWRVYRIDFSDLSDVKFFIDGSQVASGTTFDMSNLAGAELILQPYFSLDKDADVGVGTLLLDYVRIWADRT